MTAKIFRNAFLIGFTVLLACILLFFFIMYSNYQAQAYDILEVEAGHISEGMQICGGEEYLTSMQSNERITWIAPDGSVLYDNMADAGTMENHLRRPEVQEAFETGSGRSDRYSSTILEKNNYYALLLKDGTVLRVAGKQTSMAAMALMLVQPSLWIVVLVLVLCGLLAMRLAKQIGRPINAINPDNPNATPTYPELQPLISRLQEQNRTIRTQLSELSTRQREFDAITENMREGFLIVDDKCNILSSNRSALRLLGVDGTAKPENLHQAVCSSELLALVDAALDGTRGDEELSVGGGTWQLFANPVRQPRDRRDCDFYGRDGARTARGAAPRILCQRFARAQDAAYLHHRLCRAHEGGHGSEGENAGVFRRYLPGVPPPDRSGRRYHPAFPTGRRNGELYKNAGRPVCAGWQRD